LRNEAEYLYGGQEVRYPPMRVERGEPPTNERIERLEATYYWEMLI